MHQEVLLSEHDKDMLEVLKEIRKITEHISDENEAGSQADEWKFAAIVFDRFCLYIFMFLNIIAVSVTLGTAPGWILADEGYNETYVQDLIS